MCAAEESICFASIDGPLAPTKQMHHSYGESIPTTPVHTHTRTMSRAKADRRVRDHTLPRLLSADELERAASSSVCFTSCALTGQTLRAVRYGCGGTFSALGRYKYHSSSRPICDGEVLIHSHYTHNNKDAQ